MLPVKGVGLIPGQGSKIPHAPCPSPPRPLPGQKRKCTNAQDELMQVSRGVKMDGVEQWVKGGLLLS